MPKRSQDWRGWYLGWYVNIQRQSRCGGGRDDVIVATCMVTQDRCDLTWYRETRRPIPWLHAAQRCYCQALQERLGFNGKRRTVLFRAGDIYVNIGWRDDSGTLGAWWSAWSSTNVAQRRGREFYMSLILYYTFHPARHLR